MNLIHEYALLAVVAAPVVAFIAMNLSLMLTGERGTLLLPEIGPPMAPEAA